VVFYHSEWFVSHERRHRHFGNKTKIIYLKSLFFINNIIKPATNIEQAPNKNAAVICGITTEKLNTVK
jgi:hypothetical protein